MFQLAFALGNEKELCKLQDNAWKALNLVGIGPGKDKRQLHDYHLPPPEEQEIERGCYELLLTLAALKKGPEELAILDLAKLLPHNSQTHHLLQASHLEAMHKLEAAAQ